MAKKIYYDFNYVLEQWRLQGAKPIKMTIGKHQRVAVYLEGKKHYLCVGLELYKNAHGMDIKRKAKNEARIIACPTLLETEAYTMLKKKNRS